MTLLVIDSPYLSAQSLDPILEEGRCPSRGRIQILALLLTHRMTMENSGYKTWKSASFFP